MAPAPQSRSSRLPPSTAYAPAPRAHGRANLPVDADATAAAARSRARSQARRRQAVSNRLQRFESILPAAWLRSLPTATNTLLLHSSDMLVGGAAPAYGARAAGNARAGTLAQLGFSGLRWSKLISLSLLAAAIAALVWFQTDDRWYVDMLDVEVSGTALVNPGVLAQAANVQGWNVFWLRRDTLRAQLEQHPWVDEVRVAFPVTLAGGGDTKVRLAVEEAPVVAIWATESGDFLISPHGAALPVIPPSPVGLPRLIDPTFDAAVPGSPIGTAIDTDIVASALALIEQVSGVSEVRYNREVGLNFSLPGAPLWVYWGDGSLAAEKLAALDLGRRLVAMGDASKPILDVRNPTKPTLR